MCAFLLAAGLAGPVRSRFPLGLPWSPPSFSGPRKASMPLSVQQPVGVNFTTVLDSFAQVPDLPFQDVLSAEHIERIAVEEQVHFGSAAGNIYTVAVTLWAFLAQVLSKEK